MTVYLEDHPPARRQFRKSRRARVTGAIVVHTAENSTDLVLPDGGAEGVASFISRRTDAAGSYHSVVDSDSIVRVGKYEWEMFHEGTGGNRWSLGLSFACQAAQWPTLPGEWVTGALRNGANEAAAMAHWIYHQIGVVIPARRITPAEYRAREPGFISHAELDPKRRSDPGPGFPWGRFLRLFALRTDQHPGDPMPDRTDQVKRLQAYLRDADEPIDLGDTGPSHDGVDGDPGDLTVDGAIWLMEDRLDRLEAAAGEIVRLQEQLDDQTTVNPDASLGRALKALLDQAREAS